MILVTALALALATLPSSGAEQFRDAEAVRASQPYRARRLYEQSARQGYAPAQAVFGQYLFEDGNRSGALRWLKAAADQSNPKGMLLYGTALFNGDGVPSDRATGYALVARAAAAGSAEAEGTRSEMQLVMSAAERAAAARVISSTMASSKLPSAREVTISEAKRPMKVKGKLASRRTAKATPAAVRTLPTSGAWRVQLGAFRVDGSAERLFARLAPRLPGKQPTYLPLGSMTRLLAGPYESKSAAQAACRALGSGQACFAVSPD